MTKNIDAFKDILKLPNIPDKFRKHFEKMIELGEENLETLFSKECQDKVNRKCDISELNCKEKELLLRMIELNAFLKISNENK